jgi:hypothetical protein
MSTYHVPMREWHSHPVEPMTRLGRWAVITAVASGVGWLVALSAIAFGNEGVWVPWGLLGVVGLVPGFTCAIAASILAFLAMVRRGERALSVYLGYVPVACILLSSAINSLFFS